MIRYDTNKSSINFNELAKYIIKADNKKQQKLGEIRSNIKSR